MEAPQCVHTYIPSDCKFYWMIYYKSQQYVRSPVCTPLRTFRLYALLNVLLTNHSNMDAPQYVHPYVTSDFMFY